MGMPDDPVRDIMQRTMKNYRFINDNVLARGRYLGDGDSEDDPGPFEVTQLMNSFLGALMHPWEKLRSQRHQDLTCTLDQARRKEWPVLEPEWLGDRPPKTYAQMLTSMRNAFAHGNIEFIADDRNDIQKIRLWNQCNCGNRSWGTVMSVRDLERFLQFFSDLAEDKLPRPERPRRSQRLVQPELRERHHGAMSAGPRRFGDDQ